ncbi:hypothetical protein IFR04_008308 [Cadophora malorum]|uniref:Uncharacterized protein n=1 Tax=Cadophora malorum TaxID=108018 RepID=A0A8H7TFB0_9HELO|nr:hypothetical protein IFR04_008308 [Cadophora malorum]
MPMLIFESLSEYTMSTWKSHIAENDDATNAHFEHRIVELEALVAPLDKIASDLPATAERDDPFPTIMNDSFLERSRGHRRIVMQIEVLVAELHEFIQGGRVDYLDELECYRQIYMLLASKSLIGFEL